ncbi:MAG: hypothetical protein AB1589_37245, partial [Cyanobacteriota bacterium]
MRNAPTQHSQRPKQRDYLSFPPIPIFIPALLGVLIAVLGTAWTFTLAFKPQLASQETHRGVGERGSWGTQEWGSGGAKVSAIHNRREVLVERSYPIDLASRHKNSAASVLTMSIPTKSISGRLERQPLTPSQQFQQSLAPTDNSWQPASNLLLFSAVTLQ